MDTKQLKQKAAALRLDVLEMIRAGGQGHIGGSLSSLDIVTALYYSRMRHDPKNPNSPDRDRFILSKGHSVEGMLSALADQGYFPKAELATFCNFGSRLLSHPNREVPGVEMNTGSLGHGLSGGSGMAIAAQMDGRPTRVYVLMGDGEMGEGSIWEAAMLAASRKLDNLYAILDRNGLQITGPTEEQVALEPLRAKWEAFGFAVEEVDGHNFDAIFDAFDKLDAVKGKPKLLLAHTVKGKGISFIENQVQSHHAVLSGEDYERAKRELLAAIEEAK